MLPLQDKNGKQNMPSLDSKETVMQRVLPDKSCDFCRTKQLMHANLAMQDLGKNYCDLIVSLSSVLLVLSIGQNQLSNSGARDPFGGVHAYQPWKHSGMEKDEEWV